jgi:hypothetical protein
VVVVIVWELIFGVVVVVVIVGVVVVGCLFLFLIAQGRTTPMV